MDLMFIMTRGGEMDKTYGVNTYSLFPTPLVTMIYDCGKEIKAALNAEELDTINTVSKQAYGLFSKDTHLMNNPVYKPLVDVINREAFKICKEILSLKINEVKITQAWVSHKEPGEFHQTHTHANSYLSGVYYFDKTDSPLEPIVFSKNIEGSIYVNMDKENCGDKPFSWEYFEFKPVQNCLIFFPSWIKHSVGVNKTNTTRKSLAFNIMPTELGGSTTLNELKL